MGVAATLPELNEWTLHSDTFIQVSLCPGCKIIRISLVIKYARVYIEN